MSSIPKDGGKRTKSSPAFQLFFKIQEELIGSRDTIHENPLIHLTTEVDPNGQKDVRIGMLECKMDEILKHFHIKREDMVFLKPEHMRLVHHSRGDGVCSIAQTFRVLPMIVCSSPILSMLRRCMQPTVCTTMESFLALGQLQQLFGPMEADEMNTKRQKVIIAREMRLMCDRVERDGKSELDRLLLARISLAETMQKYQELMRILQLRIINAMEMCIMRLLHLREDTELSLLMTPHDKVDHHVFLRDAKKADSFMRQVHTSIARHCPIVKDSALYKTHELLNLEISDTQKTFQCNNYILSNERVNVIHCWSVSCARHMYQDDLARLLKKFEHPLTPRKEEIPACAAVCTPMQH